MTVFSPQPHKPHKQLETFVEIEFFQKVSEVLVGLVGAWGSLSIE